MERLPKNPQQSQEAWQRQISEVPPISLSEAHVFTTRAEIADFVELGALPACEALYDKNIRTISASANSNNLITIYGDRAEAYVDVDYHNLSEANQKFALRVGTPVYLGDDDTSKSPKRVKISVPIQGDTPLSEVSTALLDKVGIFEAQPLTWGHFSLSQVRRMYGLYEESDTTVIAMMTKGEDAMFLEEESGLFFPTNELKDKYLNSRDKMPSMRVDPLEVSADSESEGKEANKTMTADQFGRFKRSIDNRFSLMQSGPHKDDTRVAIERNVGMILPDAMLYARNSEDGEVDANHFRIAMLASFLGALNKNSTQAEHISSLLSEQIADQNAASIFEGFQQRCDGFKHDDDRSFEARTAELEMYLSSGIQQMDKLGDQSVRDRLYLAISGYVAGAAQTQKTRAMAINIVEKIAGLNVKQLTDI